MKGPKEKITPHTWKNLMLLGQRQGSIKLKDLAQELGLGEEETLVFLRQVFPVGIGAEIYHHDSECWIDINASAIQYMLPLSPSEWIELHQLLDSVHPTNAVQSSLKKKITDNGPIKVVMELLGELDAWDQQLNEVQQRLVHELDQAILDKKQVHLQTLEGKNYTVFPAKVLHLEGDLSLVAEDSIDHCLIVISLCELREVTPHNSIGFSQVTNFEVEEFIAAIRAMNEKETRLILKIHDPQSVNLFPDYQFLGKPCMVTNPNGDLIWAAYVEACEPLYEWLLTLGTNVEILDPVSFKQDYLSYCEEKIRKIA
jgi:hypothetical protein